MKLKTLILSGLTCLALSACTSAPVIPQLTAGVLQEVKTSKFTQTLSITAPNSQNLLINA